MPITNCSLTKQRPLVVYIKTSEKNRGENNKDILSKCHHARIYSEVMTLNVKISNLAIKQGN